MNNSIKKDAISLLKAVIKNDSYMVEHYCLAILESLTLVEKPKTLKDLKVGDTLYSNIQTCIINKGQGYVVTRVEDGRVWFDTGTEFGFNSYTLTESDFYL